MRLPQQIMSLAKAVRKPYLAGSIICICFFLLELTAWPNMSPWSWLYLAPYCIALLLLTWFPVPASMAILVTHIACAIIPAICDGPSTLYGTWLVCGIVAFEIKRFEFAIMGPLLCALALPLGYWTGGIDYNPSIPVLACSYIGAFFVGFAIRWKIQTEQRKTDLAIAQEQVRRQQKRLKEIHILHDSIAGAMTYAILLCRKKEPSESSDTLPQIEQVLMQALHELVKDKRHFVVTSNTDDHFAMAGFDRKNIFELEGNMGEMQCANGCHDTTYFSRDVIHAMLEHEEGMNIPEQYLPKCRKCGGAMQPHIQIDTNFVYDRIWRERNRDYQSFIETFHGKHLLILEFGIGARNQMIKAPFMKLAYSEPEAFYITFNKGEVYIPEQIAEKSMGVDGDLAVIIPEILKEYRQAV